jgi:cytoskeletal protein RodZ
VKRDTVKTIVGLIIIGGIVVATFLYGNSQRQAQLTHDQDVKKQQEAKAAQANAIASSSPAATSATPADSTNNTAPVPSPTSNTIQGSTSASPTASSPAPAAATDTTVAPATAPDTTNIPTTGGTGLPQTGPEMAGALGIGSITAMVIAVRRSRQGILRAARKRR